MLAGDLQPLRVLVEHRVDDVDEGLVAARRSRAGRSAGNPRASPGTVCSERISITRPSGARWSSPGSRSAIQARSCHLEQRAEPVGVVLVRAEDAEVPLRRALSSITSRRKLPRTRVASAVRRAGTRDGHRVRRGSRASAGRAAAARRWRAGWRPSAARPAAPARAARAQARRRRRTAPPAGSCAASASSSARCSGLVASVGERHLVRAPGALDLLAVDLLRAGPALRACAARSSASAVARVTPSLRARLLDRRGSSSRHAVEGAGHRRGACLGGRRPRRRPGS